MNGIINILKPPGMTSHDVVAFIRSRLRGGKVGHTGTLDPNATGVLPICLGQATRLADYLLDTAKGYRALLQLGVGTDTQDADGQTQQITPMCHIQKEDVIRVFQQFTGNIEQIPPMYSAVKLNGQKMYELARKGKEVKREARTVQIHSLDLLAFYQDENGFPSLLFDVVCSKGTYIRTLCADIGHTLGGSGHLAYLVRTMSGPFTVAAALTLEEFEELRAAGELAKYILPLDYPLASLPAVRLDAAATAAIRNGRSISRGDIKYSDDGGSRLRLYSEAGEFIAVGQRLPNGAIKPDKVFA